MINVVIADDEERICRLIQALGNWDELGLSVVGMASNGLEALRLISDKKVDILITDIRMPGLDGIELIEKVRKASEKIRVIIVSGYAEFKFAQAAVRFGVTDYLLKPINKNLLNDALLRIKESISDERENEEKLKTSETRLCSDAAALRTTLISDCLIDRNRSFTGEELREKYHIDVGEGLFQFLCVKSDGRYDREFQDFTWDKIMSLISVSLKKYCKHDIYLKQQNYLYGLLIFEKRAGEDVKKTLRSCLNQINSLYGSSSGKSISMALGYAVEDVSELGKSLFSARTAIKDRLVSGTGVLLEWKPVNGLLYESKPLEKYDGNVARALEVFSEEEIEKANIELKNDIVGNKGVSGQEILETLNQAGVLFLARLGISDKEKVLEVFNEKCDNCSSIEELFDALSTFTGELMHLQSEYRESDSDRNVRQAKRYIQNHFSEQISLEDVSEELGFTPTYFSTMFKKKTGTGFSKYLMSLRIEKAKELLKDTNDPVSEICRRVGYSDIKHFNRIFEQVSGVKPTVYRKLYG